MKFDNRELRRFDRRVRLVRAWKFTAMGLTVASVLGLFLIIADGLNLMYFKPIWGAFMAMGGFVVGGLAGLLYPLTEIQLAQSVDRRAHLQDRLSSAIQLENRTDYFSEELITDARGHLKQINPKAIYPVRIKAPQAFACLTLALLVTSIYVIDQDLLLTSDQKATRKELAKASAQIERVAKNLEISEGAVNREAEKKLAAELRKFSQDLDRGKIGREEAMQRAQKLAEDAKKLTEQRLAQASEKMERIKTEVMQEKFRDAGGDLGKLADLKLDQMEMEALRDLQARSGADQLPNDQVNENVLKALGADDSTSELLKMSEQQKQKLAEEIARSQESIQDKLKSDSLSTEDREKLEQQLNALNELMKKMELSEDVKKALNELQQMSEYHELQELMQQMQKAQQQIQQGESLTQEQIDQMQKQMEQLAGQMKDPAAQEAMRQAMKELLEQLKQGDIDMQAMQQMMSMLGMSANGQDSRGGTQGGNFMGEGENEKQDPMELEGKGKITAVRGDRDESKGQDSFTEIKAPTMLGNRTSVPYNQVLPGYKKSAESAVTNNKVKGKHRERVKEYFDQLSTGGKR